MKTTAIFATTVVAISSQLGLLQPAAADNSNTRASTLTLWWVVFNNPEHCQLDEGDPNPAGTVCNAPDLFREEVEGALLYATGQVTERNGQVTLVAPLYTTADAAGGSFDPSDAVDPFDLGTGLKNPMGAEVHTIVRSHGPIIPDELDAQITSFEGGCVVDVPRPSIPDEPGECADVHFAVHPPDDEDLLSNVYTFGLETVPGASSKLLRSEDSIRVILRTTVKQKPQRQRRSY